MFKDKKGQIAVWVIIGLVIVASVLLILFFVKGPSFFNQKDVEIQPYIDNCARKAVNDATDLILSQGGFVSPILFKPYYGKDVSYLCYSARFFDRCISLHPMLLNEIKKEIKNYTFSRIETCFLDLQRQLESESYSVNLGKLDYDVDFGPNRVYLDIKKNMTITKNEKVNNYDNFKVQIVNPTYDLALVAVDTVDQESRFCYFEYVGYMFLYPRFDIRKDLLSDSTKIYTIKDKYSGKGMRFAVYSCPYPPGN